MTEVSLVDPRTLRPIEGHSGKRVQWLIDKIRSEGVWTKPICIEREHRLVLDGMHRWNAALAMHLMAIPVVEFDYEDVDVWSLRPTHKVDREEVVRRAVAGDIYPYKTAKHAFPSTVPAISIELSVLQGAEEAK